MPPTPPTTSDPSDLRLVRALKARLEIVKSFAALARAIGMAQPGNEKPVDDDSLHIPIDRRKLQRALEEDPDVLTLADLRAIDRYLEVFGEGLAFHPLFEKPALLQSLAECKLINFLIGSRSVELHQNFSHWDLLGMAEIMRLINTCGTNVQFDIREVSGDMEDRRLLSKKLPWRDLLDEGPSLVCLGSQRTIAAAEAMARAMFGGKSFGKESLRKEDLPFHFVWSKKPAYLEDSPFHMVSDEIKHIDAAAAKLVAKGEASALALGDHVVVDQVTTPQRGGEAYGVCVAQRRGNGQVWLLVAGLAGVATYVGAKLTKDFAIHLPDAISGKPTGVYWSVIRVSVNKPTAKHPLSSVRDFPNEAIIEGPNLWTPASG